MSFAKVVASFGSYLEIQYQKNLINDKLKDFYASSEALDRHELEQSPLKESASLVTHSFLTFF